MGACVRGPGEVGQKIPKQWHCRLEVGAAMWLLPAAMLRLMTMAVRNQGTPGVTPTQRQFEGEVSNPGKEPSSAFLRPQSLCSPALRSGKEGVSEGTIVLGSDS